MSEWIESGDLTKEYEEALKIEREALGRQSALWRDERVVKENMEKSVGSPHFERTLKLFAEAKKKSDAHWRIYDEKRKNRERLEDKVVRRYDPKTGIIKNDEVKKNATL